MTDSLSPSPHSAAAAPAWPQGFLGRQIMAEFYGCPAERLREPARIEAVMREAAVACGATIVQAVFHHFNPHGVSGVVVIAESHLAIHTWPEHGYAAVDIFTCGATVDPAAAVAYLGPRLGATQQAISETNRGDLRFLADRQAQRR